MTKLKSRSITARYTSLPLIGLLLKLLGFLILGFTLAIFLFGIFAMFTRGSLAGFGLFVLQLLGGIVLSLILIAFSELIHVLLDIEENTRKSADYTSGDITSTTPRLTGDSVDS